MSVDPPVEPPADVAYVVLRALGGGGWEECGAFDAPGELDSDAQVRHVLDLAADVEPEGALDGGVAFVAVAGWRPVTVRQTMQPARVFEGL